MSVLLPQVTLDMETNMKAITEREYSRMTQPGVLWWNMVAKTRQIQTKKEVLTWLLETAQIAPTGDSGLVTNFDDLVSRTTEITTTHAGAALKLSKDNLTDVVNGIPGGEALNAAAAWSAQIGVQMAYYPQKLVTHVLKNGHNLAGAGGYTAYDGEAFFSTAHPLNPYNSGAGTYSNLVTVGNLLTMDDDDAVAALSTLNSDIAAMKMANGEDPRFLRPAGYLAGPKMHKRLLQLLNANFIAKVAGSGAGSADVAALTRALNYSAPVQADELAGFESDTSFFVVMEQLSASELGAIVVAEREPFSVAYFGDTAERELRYRKQLEYNVDGRIAATVGHPFLLIKCKAS